jgi:DNA-binding transcriptional LysR family regulator
MEIRQLEYFHEIAATGSINEAARRLNMSQPPLSYQIKQLEAELKVKLFERTRAGVTLTEAGKLLYDRTENILSYVRSTELEVSKAGKKQVLRIGITPTTVTTIMPYISRFSRENCDVNFEVRDAITFTLLNYLMDGIIDVSVVRTPIKLEGLNYLELDEEPMIAVLPPEIPGNIYNILNNGGSEPHHHPYISVQNSDLPASDVRKLQNRSYHLRLPDLPAPEN